MEDKEKSSVLPAPSVLELRENVIETAVKFLQNDKVKGSPYEQKKNFLKKKGLSDEEITAAFQRSETSEPNMQTQASHSANVNQSQPTVLYNSTLRQVSTWEKARDMSSFIIVISGFSYAVYVVAKKYLAPYFLGPNKDDLHNQLLDRSIEELKATLQQVTKNLEETRKLITSQQENKLQSGVLNADNVQNAHSLSEIKDEIKSLKGLLLSRRQFPSAPVSSPMLPSWQLVNNPSAATSSDKEQSSMESESKENDNDPSVNKTPCVEENRIEGVQQSKTLSQNQSTDLITKNNDDDHLEELQDTIEKEDIEENKTEEENS